MSVPKKVETMKNLVKEDSVQDQFQNALNENSDQFIANLIELYSNDSYLQNCQPGDVIKKALQAATLNLPLNKSLGYAYIVPFKSHGNYKPNFIIGYKGYIQLAQRTGKYKFLNADKIYEGEKIARDKLTGDVKIEGEPNSPEAPVKGYFAYMELHNGFSKTEYMTEEEVKAHAKQYSASYNNSNSAWQTDFESMALKTVIKKLMNKWGPMSTKMATAMSGGSSENNKTIQEEKNEEANQEVLDVDSEENIEENKNNNAPQGGNPEAKNSDDQKEPDYS